MKNIVVFYSFTGNTKKVATSLAQQKNADILEITDKKKPSKFKVFTLGSFLAMRSKPSKISTFSNDLNTYDVITLVSPIWAGHTTPQINAVLNMLPENKKIEVILVSASGETQIEQKLKKFIQSKNCELVTYKNVKS